MRFEYFPVEAKDIQADIQFWDFAHDVYEANWGGRFENCALHHPGTAYGYRCENNGKAVVYCTDVEQADSINPDVVRLALFHHDPDHNDDFLARMEQQCQRVFPNSFFARESMEVEV